MQGEGENEFSVGGLTPEQRRHLDDALRAQRIDVTWLGTTLVVGAGAAPQVQQLLDRARRGELGFSAPGGPAPFAPPGSAGPYAGPAGAAPFATPGSAAPPGGADPYAGPAGAPPPGPAGGGGGPYGGGPYGGGPYGGGPYGGGPYGGGPYGGGPYGGGPYGGGPYGGAPYPSPYGGPYGGYGFAPARKTNGLAIASLAVAAVSVFTCWFAILGGLIAVVLGGVARRQIRQRNEQGAGVALAGMIVGGCTAVLVLAFLALVTLVDSGSNTLGTRTSRNQLPPRTTTTVRERTGTSRPGVPGTLPEPSGVIRLEACVRVLSAHRDLVHPENADEDIVNDAARTLHLELPPTSSDDIDLVLVDALPRVGQYSTGPRPSDVQAALDRMDEIIEAGCPS